MIVKLRNVNLRVRLEYRDETDSKKEPSGPKPGASWQTLAKFLHCLTRMRRLPLKQPNKVNFSSEPVVGISKFSMWLTPRSAVTLSVMGLAEYKRKRDFKKTG